MLTKENSTITLATVYQTLKILRDDGEIRELAVERERLHYDPDTSLHHHAVCDSCGSVSDIRGFPTVHVPMPEHSEQNFNFSGYHIAFYGTCERCRER